MLASLKGAILSFYSRPFYNRIAHGRGGIGFSYINLLTLLLLLSLILGFVKSGAYGIMSDAIHNAPQWSGNMPAITLKNGKVSIDKPVPFHSDLGTPREHAWLVIDTNYKTGDLETLRKFMEQNAIPVLITENEFIILKVRQHAIEIYDLKQQPDFTISHEKWIAFGQWIKQWGMPTIIGGLLFIFYLTMLIGNLVITFLTAAIALIIGAIAKAELDMASSMRLVAAFRIPVFIFSIVLAAIGIPGVVSWIVWFFYLVFSVIASKPGNEPLSDQTAG